MRIVFDTNVYVSAVIFGRLPEKVISMVLARQHHIILSSYIITEVDRILGVKFQATAKTKKLFQTMASDAEIVYFEPYLNILDDKPDNLILETAVTGQADYIVAGDKALLSLKEYKNIQILTIKDCQKLLEK